ncbi:TPA: hypothetical protein ACTXXA_001537 [Legionella anisa]
MRFFDKIKADSQQPQKVYETTKTPHRISEIGAALAMPDVCKSPVFSPVIVRKHPNDEKPYPTIKFN